MATTPASRAPWGSFNIGPQTDEVIETVAPPPPPPPPPVPELSASDGERLGISTGTVLTPASTVMSAGTVSAASLMNVSNPASVVLAGLTAVDGAAATINGAHYIGTANGWVSATAGADFTTPTLTANTVFQVQGDK